MSDPVLRKFRRTFFYISDMIIRAVSERNLPDPVLFRTGIFQDAVNPEIIRLLIVQSLLNVYKNTYFAYVAKKRKKCNIEK